MAKRMHAESGGFGRLGMLDAGFVASVTEAMP